jgi:hypothetical protein
MTIKPKYERQPKRVRKRDLADKPTPAESKAAYEAVKARSGGICEACGKARAEAMHHRLYRSRLGQDTVANLLHVCGRGNKDKCHGIAHTLQGEQRGLSVKSGNDPASIPYFRKSDSAWRMPNEPEPIHPGTAVEIMVAFGQINYGGQL